MDRANRYTRYCHTRKDMAADLEAAHWERVLQDGSRGWSELTEAHYRTHENKTVCRHKSELHERERHWVPELIEDDLASVRGKCR